MTSLSRPPPSHSPTPSSLLPCIFKLASPSIPSMPPPCYFTLPFSVPQLTLLKFSSLNTHPYFALCPTQWAPKCSHLPHTFPFSPLCHLRQTSICLTLPSAPLVPLPFGLPSALLCSLLHFAVCPTLPSSHLNYSLLCFTTPSAMLHSAICPLIPLLYSALCFTLPSPLL
jgi:hypothetical protein